MGRPRLHPERVSTTQALLADAATRPAPEVDLRENPYLACFAKNWCGTIKATRDRCAQDGFPISEDTATRYLRDPRFITYTQLASPLKPGEGIWTVEDIKRFLTRVAAGLEPDRHDLIIIKEPILPCDDDYDHDLEGEQWRRIEKQVPIYPTIKERTKATELLGKTMAAFSDNVNVHAQFSIVSLLDVDLADAKPVLEITSESQALQVVDSVAQLIDAAPVRQDDIDSLL